MSRLFEKVQSILKSRQLSQAEFSRKIQVTPQRYSKWLHGTGEPGPSALLRIARVLNVTIESLIDDQLEPAAPLVMTDSNSGSHLQQDGRRHDHQQHEEPSAVEVPQDDGGHGEDRRIEGDSTESGGRDSSL